MGIINQAFLITAYKDPSALVNLIERAKDFYVYVHIDKKNKCDFFEVIDKYRDNPRVTFFSKYKVSWGSFNHVKAVLFLMNKVIKNDNICYVHVLSGQDYPVRSDEEFRVFEDEGKIYMSCTPIGDTSDLAKRRYLQKHITANLFDIRSRNYRRFDKKLRRARKRIGLFRVDELYKGLIWASMPINICRYICCYVRSFSGWCFFQGLKFCEVPEEIFLQTIIMHSQYKDKVVEKDLRYTLWEERNGSDPAVLDESDFDSIINSDAFFARKIDSVISSKLKKLIDKKQII